MILNWPAVAGSRQFTKLAGLAALAILILVSAPSLTAPSAHAADVFVDDDDPSCNTGGSCGGVATPCCTIQAAICNAGSGDDVRVLPGTYTESLRMKSGVDVVSEQGPAVTIVDAAGQRCTGAGSGQHCSFNSGQLPCSVVIINSSVSAGERLEGFTLTGGGGTVVDFGIIMKRMGGAIVNFGSPLITNNVITGNTLTGSTLYFYGGGIAITRPSIAGVAQPIISNNTITGNTAKAPPASGMAYSQSYGGGIYSGYGSVSTIQDNRIEDNDAGEPLIEDNVSGAGGGIYLANRRTQGTHIITRNLISGNRSYDSGAGIQVSSYCLTSCEHSRALVTNNEIRNNTAGRDPLNGRGGGIDADQVSLRLFNNTIVANDAGFVGGTHARTDNLFPTDLIEDGNNFYSGNISGLFGTGGGFHAQGTCHSIRNTGFWQNQPSQIGGECTDALIGTSGIIQADPLFANPVAGDYRQVPLSPAVDSGNNADAPADDRDMKVRPADGDGDGTLLADMGEYELSDGDCDGDGTLDSADPDDDSDGDPDGTDCSPCDANVFTGATEICNLLDDDCTGIADDDADTDADGAFNCLDCAINVNSAWSLPPPLGPTIVFDPSSLTDFRWDRIVQGIVYNVYRGTLPAAPDTFNYDHTCLEPESPDLESLDPMTPPVDTAFFYIVSGVNFCGEGNLGMNSLGFVRPSGIPCGAQGADSDSDTVPDVQDNCTLTPNLNQADLDQDTLGDACDSDSDNDGVDDGSDCAPFDPGAFAIPTEITGVAAINSAPTDLTWDLQVVGVDTDYDVATGFLSDAFANDYGPGTCLASDVSGPPFSDTRGPAAPDDGYYYMIRAENVCLTTGTYGEGTATMDRDSHGSTGSPCP